MIKLIVDSTFGLTKEYIKENDISVVNLKLILDGVVTDEGGVDKWAEFYERLEKSENFPTTSQPSPQDFISAIEKIYKKEENAEVLILTIAESLSGTINSAKLAVKEFENKKIEVMDSHQGTVGSKILCEAVVDKINAGSNFEEIVEYVKVLQKKIELFFVPTTMEYLKRGGRIGKLSATLASVLSIKPIFLFKDGVISVSKKVLGLSRALNDMVLSLPKELEKLYICYIYNNENVKLIADKLKTLINLDNIEIMPVSPVFGCHVGIGALGLAALAK